ncbi:N-formylglutamate amidohydrolase [Roseobacter denitrificans]|uniref:N-formylglutamate amidohydrolase n=1 Tax=Roseobacter denitrificans (strain ATCC 33942 / OCh 114) TaxID=375451 RepID=Q16A61_ROSDO|nr:N-formylglutamate amidohydrolase [Roseobacter denitrificans]ABG31132.1 conserved hypothetical protein [Roseobacter denitrificans OCh 114]AVL55022.1 N-formylglutamate amidohydrolase [Roseobacter denitrificans]SFG32469.1 Predicted N-formylglutamate amidohydrolase [Roseobacter denitrificans OCh 114]
MTQSNAIDASHARNARQGTGPLLGAQDPAPIEVCHAESAAPLLLLCEHAGQVVPQALGGLGLPEGAIDGHIGWDIGAEKLARALAERLQCPLILQRYSRLVIDCNRPPGSEGSIPTLSDDVPVPGNMGLTAHDRHLRQQEIFDPMNDAITAAFETHPRHTVFSIHSYTRHFQGEDRQWDAGFLTRQDVKTAQGLMSSISNAAPELTLALNQPYQIDDASDWFIPQHAEARRLQHALIEVRNDHLRDADGVARWAGLLAPAIRSILEDTP